MPRPEKPIDYSRGPVAELAAELRALRIEAGTPTYRELAARAGYSPAVLSQAAAGRQLPSWSVVQAFVAACGADPESWRQRWHDIQLAVQVHIEADQQPDFGSAGETMTNESSDLLNPSDGPPGNTVELGRTGQASAVDESSGSRADSRHGDIRRFAGTDNTETVVHGDVGPSTGQSAAASDALYRTLGPQERRVLDQLAAGRTNRQIAAELRLAEKTVKNYVSSVLHKLGFDSRTEAAVFATRLIFSPGALASRSNPPPFSAVAASSVLEPADNQVADREHQQFFPLLRQRGPVDVVETITPPNRATEQGLQFKILGPIEVSSGATPVRIPPGRQPVILGALLLEPNRVVSIDRLIDVVWDEKPPATARTQVQICVAALRHMFTDLGVEQPIETRPPGYLLRVAEEQIDSQTFAALVAGAVRAQREGLLDEAVGLLRKALELWRGPALGGECGSILRSATVRLEESRLNALETCIGLELRLGRHQQLVGELGGLVEEYPLRERLRGQLMTALYRSGRPAEALEVYRAGWRIMVHELGLEPGEELRALETAILNEDQGLQLETRDTAPGHEPRPPAGPHQLPTDIVDFTGREDLIEQAEAALLDGDPTGSNQAVRVVAFTGKAGIGKTALAVHIAHRVAERRFAGGQLFCSLAGMQRDPLSPSDVLGRFLRALGVPGSTIPNGLDERAEMYRSLLAGQQLLVVLDDVATVRQIIPLLPGSGSCAVIVTCRMRLTEIPGARVFDVDLLQPENALELLGNVVGRPRVAEESTAAVALVRMVGGLPLALRIVAARLAARPHWSLASMVGRLTDERRRLDELAHGDLMVRASLRLTYEGLEPRDARLFRLLGILPEGSIPAWVAAALLDEDPVQVAARLERLVDMQMLDVTGPDLDGQPRYGLHAIIRLFAREELALEEDASARRVALERMLGGWLALAERMRRAMYGSDLAVLRGTAPRWQVPDSADAEPVDAMLWFEAESAHLVAAVEQAADEGLDELCWDLTICLVTLFERGGYAGEWERTHERALEVVRAAGNRRGEAILLSSLGSLHISVRRLAAARAALEPALDLFEELGDAHGLAMIRRNLGVLLYIEGAKDAAAVSHTAALNGFRTVGDVLNQAYVLSKLAQISSDAGDHQRASDLLNEGLEICRDVGSRRVEAQVLHQIGKNLTRQRRHDEADLVLSTVLDLVRGQHDVEGEGIVLHALGLVRAKLGRRDEAVELLRAAISMREQIMDYLGAVRVRLDLAPILAEQGDQAVVVQLVEGAVSMFGARRMAALAPARPTG